MDNVQAAHQLGYNLTQARRHAFDLDPATPNPHMYQVWDTSMPVPSAHAMVAQFHDYAAAKDYALQVSQFNGYILSIVKGEYAR